MKKNHIVLLTGNDNFFGQTRRPWVSMNVDRMQEILQKNGITRNIRDYIKDILYYLDDGSNLLIPSFEMLLCHEDKGFQELYKKKINFSSLKAYFLSDKNELPNYYIDYPIVVKSVGGSNGKRVYLAKNKNELIKAVKKFESVPFKDKIDLFRRKYLRPTKTFKEYPDFSNRTDYLDYKDYVKKQQNFILQEYVPELEYDFRVLVLFDKYYVTKRHNRKDDFRASGAKKFDFDFEPDSKMLDFSKNFYDKFNTPFLSIDVGLHQNNYYLFEFQALHFGINVFVKSQGYYSLVNDKWKFYESKPDFEKEISEALVKYIKALDIK